MSKEKLDYWIGKHLYYLGCILTFRDSKLERLASRVQSMMDVLFLRDDNDSFDNRSPTQVHSTSRHLEDLERIFSELVRLDREINGPLE